MSALLWFFWMVIGGAVATGVMMRVLWLKDQTPGVKWLDWIFAWAFLRTSLRTTRLAVPITLVLLGRPANVAATDFAAAKSYAVGTSPAAIAVGDFNGDGKVDIAVANTGSGDVSILLGNGDGTFQPVAHFSAGNSPTAIAVGDFNGDGKLDLAVFQPTANGVSGSVGILFGNGDGTFQAPKIMTFSQRATFMAVADFNLDRKSDLAVCDSTGLDIFLGNGDGTFQTAKTVSSSNCIGITTADFNGDSKPDVALVTTTGIQMTTGIQILLGKGDGTFTQGASISEDGVIPPLVVADFNHDGKVDLVVNAASRNCAPPPPACQNPFNEDISVFLGNGDGTFQGGKLAAFLTFPLPRRATRLFDPLVGDFNGDGQLDLAYGVFPPSVASHLTFLLGKGDGFFSPPVLDLPGAPSIAQDLNGDGLADLIAVGGANNIEVFLNASPASGADLGVLFPSSSPGGPVGVGTNLEFTADVVNQGPKDATGVTFTDILPNGTNFVSAAASQGSCVQSNGIVSCSIGPLASASDSSVGIVVTPTAVGTISNTMNVTGNEPDLVPGNNSATQTVTIAPLVTLTVTDAGGGAGTVTSNPVAIDCGSTCSANYLQGASVSLSVTAAAGSVFSGWSGACTGTDPNTCHILMNAAESVTATFSLAPDFTLAPASTSFTMQTGMQVTDDLTLTEQNGFSGQVNLSCTVNGPAPLATCGVSPSPVTVGSSSGMSKLTITAPSSLMAVALPFGKGSRLAAFAVVLPVPGLLLGGIALASRRTRKHGVILWFLGGSVVVLLVVLAGCGGGNALPPPPPPKNYMVIVNATSATGSLQHSTTVALTVE